MVIITSLPSIAKAEERESKTELYLAGFDSSEITEEIVNNAIVTEELIETALSKGEGYTASIGLNFSGTLVSGSFSLSSGQRLIMNRHMAIGQTGNAKYIGNNY